MQIPRESTIPPVATTNVYAFTSDHGVANLGGAFPARQRQVADRMKSWGAKWYLFGGDNAYTDGSAADIAAAWEIWEDQIDDEIVFPAIGNHDLDTVTVNNLPVAAVATEQIDLEDLIDGLEVDGVTLATGDLVLLPAQTDTEENGVYTVGVTESELTALDPPDYQTNVTSAAGTVNAGTVWVMLEQDVWTQDINGLPAVAFAPQLAKFPYLPGNRRYYSVSDDLVAIYFLNSGLDSDSLLLEPDGNTASSEQREWLIEEIAERDAHWNIVVFHHPQSTSSDDHRTGNDDLAWDWRELGVDLVLNGHSHNYERLEIDRVPIVVAGNGGQTLSTFTDTAVTGSQKRSSFYGAVRLTVTDSTLDLYAIAVDGVIKDRLNLVKNIHTDDQPRSFGTSSTTSSGSSSSYATLQDGDGGGYKNGNLWFRDQLGLYHKGTAYYDNGVAGYTMEDTGYTFSAIP